MARTREFDTDEAVRCAMEAFCCRGFDGTSVQDLVDATGVGRGSLYAAFGSKEGLYLAALDRYREQLAEPCWREWPRARRWRSWSASCCWAWSRRRSRTSSAAGASW